MTHSYEVEKSEGHIDFIGKYEYYTMPNGNLYRAPKQYPVMPEGRRSGRWEAKASQIKDYMAMIRQI